MSRSCSVAVVEEKTLFFLKRRVFPQGLCTGYRSCVSNAAVECATVDYAAVGTYDRRACGLRSCGRGAYGRGAYGCRDSRP